MVLTRIALSALVVFSSAANASPPKTIVNIAMTNYSTFSHANGIHRQVVERVFEQLPQYQLRWQQHMSLSRSLTELAAGRVNGIVNITYADQPSGCLTDPAFNFFNLLVVYRPSGVVLNDLSALKDKAIISFIRANKLMGIRYASAVAGNLEYQETRMQEHQVQSLVKGMAQVSVGDINIFIDSLQRYNRRMPESRRVKVGDFDYYWLNNIVQTKIAFDDTILCDEFNRVLKKYIKPQQLPAILTQHNIKLIEL